MNAHEQPLIEAGDRAVLELAHPALGKRNQLLHPVRHRGVDRVLAAFRLHLPIAAAAHHAAGVFVLGERDQLRQQPDLILDVGMAAEDHLDDLVEIEQPERQPQVSGAYDMGAVLETGAVLVVRVDQQDAQVRARLHDLAQDQRDRARLAGPGAAENREVLAHHVVDVDIGADRVVLLQVSDVDRVGPGGVENDPQFIVSDRDDDAADPRIDHHAALEVSAAGLVVDQLAEQIHLADSGGLLWPSATLPRDTSQSAPITSERPFQMPRKVPTVTSELSSCGERSSVANCTITCEPATETTRPSGSGASMAGES